MAKFYISFQKTMARDEEGLDFARIRRGANGGYGVSSRAACRRREIRQQRSSSRSYCH